MLAKDSPIPLYYQLAEWLQEQIASSALAPGAQLPSERELSERAGVSRMTARQALAYLVRQGLLEVKPGVGTFVAAPKLAYDALHLLGFTEEMSRTGANVTSTVLEQTLVSPPAQVARELLLPVEAPTVKIVRLRCIDEQPLLLETSFLPALLCPDLEARDLAGGSLYALLAEVYGLRLRRARQTCEATIANDYEQRLFGLSGSTAVLLVQGVAYDDADRPVEYFKSIYRGDRCVFSFESQRTRRAEEVSTTAAMRILVTG